MNTLGNYIIGGSAKLILRNNALNRESGCEVSNICGYIRVFMYQRNVRVRSRARTRVFLVNRHDAWTLYTPHEHDTRRQLVAVVLMTGLFVLRYCLWARRAGPRGLRSRHTPALSSTILLTR